jgi:NAD(P)H-dependent flavin oxidoreductase YrpB (nitropropane dioxygenase family)
VSPSLVDMGNSRGGCRRLLRWAGAGVSPGPGVEGIAMGTRFAVTRESDMPPNIKQRNVEATETHTVITAAITGTVLRVLCNRLTDMLEGGQRLSWRERISSTLEARKMLGVSWWQFIIGGFRMRKAYEASFSELGQLAAGAVRGERAFVYGDAEFGAIPAGQVGGRHRRHT